MNAPKITVQNQNANIRTPEGAAIVRGHHYNILRTDVETIETQINSGAAEYDTIAEKTAGSGVTIDGVLIKDGVITTTGPVIKSVDAAITATGTDDTDGYAITEEINVITGGAANTGVELPTAVVGLVITIANLTASVKKVYANTTDGIDDKTATTGFITLQPEDVVTFYCYTVALWQSDYETGGATQITAGDGAVGTPSINFVSDLDTGFYALTGDEIGVSANGVQATTFGTYGVATDAVKCRVTFGTTPVGTVSITEYGYGRDRVSVLVLTDFIIGALAGAGAALAIGNIVFEHQASNNHLELVSSFSQLILTCAGTAVAADVGLGSVIGSTAVATLGAVGATSEDRLTGQTINTAPTGGAAVDAMAGATAGFGTGISMNLVGDEKSVFLNAAGTWNADNTGNLTASGTIVLKWTDMGS